MVNSGLPAEGNQLLHAVRVPVCASVLVLGFIHRADHEPVGDGGEGVVVIAGSRLFIELVPQLDLPGPAQSSPADAEEVEHVMERFT